MSVNPGIFFYQTFQLSEARMSSSVNIADSFEIMIFTDTSPI